MGVKPQTRTARLDIRLTPSDKEALERIAKKAHRTLSSFIQEWIEILKKDEKPPWES